MNTPTPHLAVIADNGTVIALPVTAWFDQTLARSILAHAGAHQPPPLDDDKWLDLVFHMLDHADTKASTS